MGAGTGSMFETHLSGLWLVVIQERDTEEALAGLGKLGVVVVRMSSVGGFLGARNSTLLLAVQPGQEKAILEALKRTCHQRTEYISMPSETMPLPTVAPVAITVGGAVIFELEIDRYEEVL